MVTFVPAQNKFHFLKMGSLRDLSPGWVRSDAGGGGGARCRDSQDAGEGGRRQPQQTTADGVLRGNVATPVSSSDKLHREKGHSPEFLSQKSSTIALPTPGGQ